MTTLALARKTLHITAMAVPLRGEGLTTVHLASSLSTGSDR